RMGASRNYYTKQDGGGGYGYGGQHNQDGGMYGGADASAYGSNGYDNHHQQPVS
nr:polyadenylate-binding protein RBP47-like [Tanacetum cinerariifolium]